MVGSAGPCLHVLVDFLIYSCREKYSRDRSLHHQAPGCSYHCGQCQSHRRAHHHCGGPLQGGWVYLSQEDFTIDYQSRNLLTRACLCPGGLGEAVLSAVGKEPGIVVTRLAVNGVPRSGKPQELLDIFGISAKHIADAVRQTFAN